MAMPAAVEYERRRAQTGSLSSSVAVIQAQELLHYFKCQARASDEKLMRG
jgi:hypothetical protein